MPDSAKRWRLAFLVSAGLLVPLVCFLAYLVIDQAVTLSYISDSTDSMAEDYRTLAAAFPRDRYDKKDILTVLRRNAPTAFIVETKCTVELEGVRFEFNSAGQLVGINSQAEFSPDYDCGT